MKKLTTTMALAMVSAAFLTTAASAVQISTGDLVLAFRDGSEANSGGNDLEVNLGLESSFDFSTIHAVSGLTETDLDTIFGSGASSVGSYANDATLVFGLDGTDSSHDLFYSDPNDDFITPTTISSTTTDSGFLTRLNGSFTSTSDSGGAAAEVADSTGASYSSAIRNVNGTYAGTKPYTKDFNFLTFVSEEKVTGGVGSLELIESDHFGDDPQDLGTFSLLSNGTLEYTAVTIPEPSTYALMGFAGLVMLFVRRRMIKGLTS